MPENLVLQTIVDPYQQQMHERLLGQIGGGDISSEERQAMQERFASLVKTVSSWAVDHEHDIDTVVPLGGGFKNPVLLLTTVRGEQFVAKAFTEEQSLKTTREAQIKFNSLFNEDERLLPKSEIFNDTLFSEKAKGSAVKTLIAEAINNPEQIGRAEEAFFAVGATLGMLHERTERPILSADDITAEVAENATMDREKINRHLEELSVASLVGMDPETVAAIKDRVKEFTEPEYVSLIHGDAHLDQFFHEDGGASVEIVDYDDVREGDPMADLGRVISSQRDWCREYKASPELEIKLTRSIAKGYASARQESGLVPNGEELDMMRVVAYELRLQLVKLKNFGELRQKLKVVEAHLGLDEHEIAVANGDQATVIDQYLYPNDRQKLAAMRVVTAELTDIMQYLRPIPSVESSSDDHTMQQAA